MTARVAVITAAVAALGCLTVPAATAADAAAAAAVHVGAIAFDDVKTGEIYTVEPDGSHFRQVTHDGPDVLSGQPSWSPDGRRIVFRREVSGHDQLYTMAADGSDRHLVRAEPKRFDDNGAQYFPAGNRLIFSRCSGDGSGCRIGVMRTDGTHLRFLTAHRHEVYDVGATVAPDGKSIAFGRFNAVGRAGQVWLMRADGTHIHPVTATTYEAYAPDFAPGAKRLLFNTNCCRLGGNVWVTTVAGRRVRQLTHTRYPLASGNGVFSPNASRVAVVSNRRYPQRCCGDMYIVPVGHGMPHRVPLPVNHPNDLAWRAPTRG